MPEFDNIVIFITTGSESEAQKIGQLLLERRQAACVNIVPVVNSSYLWKGKLDSDKESLLIVKTRTAKLDSVVDSVREAHSYEVPEIIALPIIGGNRDYLDWIAQEVPESF